MASPTDDKPPVSGPTATPGLNPNDKVVHVWSTPVEDKDAPSDGSTPSSSNNPPTLRNAISTIKSEDFSNVARMPCARQGLMTGIGAGAGFGGLSFVIRGSIPKSINWAMGMFLAGSMASYEYCQYLRRAERRQMKRHIEVVTENKREQAKKLAEAREKHKALEEERKAAERPWYKVW